MRPRKWAVEECPRVDLWALRRDGSITPGASGVVSWTSSGGFSGSVAYRVDCAVPGRPVLVLDYGLPAIGGLAPVRDRVALEVRPAMVGGFQWWLRCPRCGGRCARLYMPPESGRFACRVCWDLSYRSVQEHDARIDALRADWFGLFRRGPGAMGGGWVLAMRAYLKGPLLCRRRREPREREE